MIEGDAEVARPLLKVLILCEVAGARKLLQSVAVTVVYDAGTANHLIIKGTNAQITLNKNGTARSRTSAHYPSGSFIAKVQCPAGNTSGIVTTFYTSSLEGSKTQDEIDFEFLGDQKSTVQTNYYVNGTGGHEIVHQLGFDTSAAAHVYNIYWDSTKIVWYVDGKLLRTVNNDYVNPFPAKAQYVYQSIWDASLIGNGTWAGVNTWASAPYVAKWTNITVNSPY